MGHIGRRDVNAESERGHDGPTIPVFLAPAVWAMTSPATGAFSTDSQLEGSGACVKTCCGDGCAGSRGKPLTCPVGGVTTSSQVCETDQVMKEIGKGSVSSRGSHRGEQGL